MVRLPLLPADDLVALLTAGLSDLDKPGNPAAVRERLFGAAAQPAIPAPPAGATLRELYRNMVATEPFRAALGRISASYAW